MEPQGRLSSPQNPVNFLKIILTDNTQYNGIRLPEKFTKAYGKCLSESVTLKVPNGDVWQVDLHRSGDEIWLKNGWGKFAEHYSLKFSSLLMFKYEGFSRFGVIIFDASASEIDYPKSKNPDHLRNSAKRDAGKLNDFKTVIKDEDSYSSSSGEYQEQGFKIYDEGECSRSRRRKVIQRKEEGRTLEKAKSAFKSDEAFFMVPMSESYVTKSGVYIPNGFRRKLLSMGYKELRECLLQLKKDVKEKSWEVIVRDKGFVGNTGWLKFVKDNGIKVGDVCVFELLHDHKDKIVFDVTIVRSAS